jgi:hypothetical protein
MRFRIRTAYCGRKGENIICANHPELIMERMQIRLFANIDNSYLMSDVNWTRGPVIARFSEWFPTMYRGF